MSLLNEFEAYKGGFKENPAPSFLNDERSDNELLEYYLRKEGGKEQLFKQIDYILNGDGDLLDEEDPYDDNGGPIQFRKIHDAMEAVGWGCYVTGHNGEPVVPTAEELKTMLKKQLFELFEQKCHSIDGIWHTSYDIDREPDSNTPDDFEHRVNICVMFNFEVYNSLW